MMKTYFNNQLEAVLWIANHAKSEWHFRILREELDLNHLLTDEYFLHSVTIELDVMAMAA